jgi:PmbA protein
VKGLSPEFAVEAVRLALESGATGAECMISEGSEFSAHVRMRELETLKEAGSRVMGLQVLLGQRAGSSYTSDFSTQGRDRLVRSALEIARVSSVDPHAGLPDASDLGAIPADLNLYCDDVELTATSQKIEWAREAEDAALAADARITNSEGATFDAHASRHVLANSLGFVGSYRTTRCSLSVTPVARENGSMERDYWMSRARGVTGLESPAEVGRKAAERTVRRLGARKISTQTAPVIFEPRVARSLLGHIFDAVSGDSIYRKASFLAGGLGRKIASEHVTVIDDGTLPGLFGTSPFDDEGVPTRRTVVIDRGVLSSYLMNSYAARKLGMKTTGNAARGASGRTMTGYGNLYLDKGTYSPEQIVRSFPKALYVMELIGSGVNIVTGDYSRGTAGVWIENGEFAYPVSEITIAGNLRDMLMNLEIIGNDLEFNNASAAPTVVIGEMTISGQ